MFARDLSGVHPFDDAAANPRKAADFHVLADNAIKKIPKKKPTDPQQIQVLGPVCGVNQAWRGEDDHSEVLPGPPLFGGAMTPERRSTFRVARAVAEAEAFGFFECGNAYDDQMISFGLCNWTIRRDGGGELPGFLAYLAHLAPDDFEKAVGRAGLRPALPWHHVAGGADGRALHALGGAKRTYETSLFLTLEDGVAEPYPAVKEEQYVHRNWPSIHRWVMAGRVNDGYRRAMWDMIRMRLRDVLAKSWPAEKHSPADPNFPTVDGRPATFAETFRSERSLGVLLRLHVKSPGTIVGLNTNGANIFGLWRTVGVNFAGDLDPTSWSPEREAQLTDAIVKRFGKLGGTTVPEIEAWLQPGNASARRYRLRAAAATALELATFEFQRAVPAVPADVALFNDLDATSPARTWWSRTRRRRRIRPSKKVALPRSSRPPRRFATCSRRRIGNCRSAR